MAACLVSGGMFAYAQDSSVTDLAIPDGAGSPRSVYMSPGMGSVSDMIPIEIAPGRRGVRPRLMLSYSSMGGQGSIGLGWQLAVGYVEIWRGDGTPGVGEQGRFFYSIGGCGGEIIDVGQGVYRAATESTYREFRRIDSDGDGAVDGWEMSNGEGMMHRFGGTPESRIDGKHWKLDQVRDPSGNTVNYYYQRMDEEIYLTEIRYTGFAPTDDPGSNQVVFDYEARPDARLDYSFDQAKERAQRLRRISVFAGLDLVRRYELEYTLSPLNGQSLLHRVILVGADDESRITAKTLEYGERELAATWHKLNPTGDPPENLSTADGKETGAKVCDVNGDGYADFLDNGSNVYLGDGQGGFAKHQGWSASLAAVGVEFVNPDSGVDQGVRLIDVNTDGRPDLFIAQTDRREVWLNKGDGWYLDPDWSANLDSLSANAMVDPLYIEDIDPDFAIDDFLDLLLIASRLNNHKDEDGVSLFLWNEEFSESTRELIAKYISGDATAGALLPVMVEEYNAVIATDSTTTQSIYEEVRFAGVLLSDETQLLLDIVSDPGADPSLKQKQILRLNRLLLEDAYPVSLARSYTPPDLSQPFSDEPFAIVDADGYSKGVMLTDINADGRLDILWSMDRGSFLYWHGFRMPIRLRSAYLNTGSGWESNEEFAAPLWDESFSFVSDSQIQGYAFADLNGDGLVDLMRSLEGKMNAWFGVQAGELSTNSYSESLNNNGLATMDADRNSLGVMPVDFNDDGLVDYMVAKEGEALRAYKNMGREWEASPEMTWELTDGSLTGLTFSTADGKTTGVTTCDLNGDGLIDFIKAKEDEPYQIWLSSGLRSDLLVKSTSALGEVTEIAYGMSTEFNNKRLDEREIEVEGLPVPMVVATQMTTRDGRGGVFTTSHDYYGGYFVDRQFRSFRTCIITRPNGLVVEKTHNQTKELLGKMMVEEYRDNHPSDPLRLKQSFIYEVVDAGSGIRQVRLLQNDTIHADPNGSRHSRVKYGHDERLNLVWLWRDPDTSIARDDRTTEFSWALNTEAGIWGLPARTSIFDSDGHLMKDSLTLYDGMPEGQAARGLATEVQDMVQPGQWVSRSMTYNQYGNIASITDRNGETSTFEYGDPAAAFRTRATDAEGRVVVCSYDPRWGAPEWSRDASGNESRYGYDAFGRKSWVQLPGDESSPLKTERYDYSSLGDPQAQFVTVQTIESPTSTRIMRQTTFFDAMALAYRIEKNGPEGQKIITRNEYDDSGNVVSQSQPFYGDDSQRWTDIQRDMLHRPVLITDPDGLTTKLVHAGPRVEIINRRGKRTEFVRDADANIVATHQWENGEEQITQYEYDVLGRMTRMVDAIGEETRITYDALGRTIRLEDPNAGTYEYAYDAEGHLTDQAAPDGTTVRFDYNAMGQLEWRDYSDGTEVNLYYGGPGDENAVGRLIRVVDAAGEVEMKYDARGRIVEQRRTTAGSTYVTGYAFDSIDRVTRIIYPDGFTVNCEYDNGGNPSRVTDAEGQLIAQAGDYAASGQIGTIAYGNDVASAFVYDKMLRMNGILTQTADAQVLQDLNYAFDEGGNVLSILDGTHGASQEFTYSDVGRLIRAKSALYGVEEYEYDAIGNLLRKGNTVYSMDPLHPQRAIRIDNQAAVNPAGNIPHKTIDSLKTASYEVTYDGRGNVVKKDYLQYEYDAQNFLMAVWAKKGRLIEQNIYGFDGGRVIQRTPQSTTVFIDGIYEQDQTHASRHVYLGSLLVATITTPSAMVDLITSAWDEPQLFVVASWAGSNRYPLLALCALLVLIAARRALREGAWGRRLLEAFYETGYNLARRPRFAGTALLLIVTVTCHLIYPQQANAADGAKQESREKRYFYHQNHLGSINVVTDEKARVVSRRAYKPYGETAFWTGAQSGPRKFQQGFGGQRLDEQSGHYYFGARYYDAGLGRFLSADTHVPDPMNPRALNRYAFANGNPIRYVDPTGHGFWDVFLGILVSVVLIVAAVVLTVVTFGAAAPLGTFMTGVALAAILGLAGAGAFGIYAASKGMGITSKGFWLSVAAGFALGAAIGGGLAALPYALGGGLTPLTFLANALVGSMFGAIETTITHFVKGGGPEGLILDLLISAGIGAAMSLVMGSVFGKFKYGMKGIWKKAPMIFLRKGLVRIGTTTDKLVGTILKNASIMGIINGGKLTCASMTGQKLFTSYLPKQIYAGLDYVSVGLVLIMSAYINSPPTSTGLPAWAFTNASPGSNGADNVLNIMPMRP